MMRTETVWESTLSATVTVAASCCAASRGLLVFVYRLTVREASNGGGASL